jgi:BlaI family transcriptional regulator, penicillinase repressor
MRRNAHGVTEAEFALLEALWGQSTQTIRALTARLYPAQSVSDYATVQKLLARLEAKGFVRRDRDSRAHVFRATCDRHELVGGQLARIADKLCDGSLTPLLLHLVERSKLSKADRAMLRELLDKADKK